jgi:hypothetical protein
MPLQKLEVVVDAQLGDVERNLARLGTHVNVRYVFIRTYHAAIEAINRTHNICILAGILLIKIVKFSI